MNDVRVEVATGLNDESGVGKGVEPIGGGSRKILIERVSWLDCQARCRLANRQNSRGRGYPCAETLAVYTGRADVLSPGELMKTLERYGRETRIPFEALLEYEIPLALLDNAKCW